MEVKDKVFDKVAETLRADRSALTLETRLQDLGADSLDLVEFSIDLETEFGITVEQADIAKIDTLGDAVSFIEGRIK